MTARSLPLFALLALAACGRGGEGVPAANQMSNDLLDPAQEMARRWGTVFTDAARRARAASELGYRLPAPGATGVPPTFVAHSDVQKVVIGKSPVETRTTLETIGTSAATVDRYIFRFSGSGDDGQDTGAASDVDKIPARVMLGFLQRFEVQPDDEIKVAVRGLKPIHKALPGATFDFVPEPPADPQRPRNRRSVLTITRPEAAVPAPTTSAPRK